MSGGEYHKFLHKTLMRCTSNYFFRLKFTHAKPIMKCPHQVAHKNTKYLTVVGIIKMSLDFNNSIVCDNFEVRESHKKGKHVVKLIFSLGRVFAGVCCFDRQCFPDDWHSQHFNLTNSDVYHAHCLDGSLLHLAYQVFPAFHDSVQCWECVDSSRGLKDHIFHR